MTGPDYGRIYDQELVAAVQRIAGNGTGDTRWKVPGVLDWSTGVYDPVVDVTKSTTTLYASDRDVFLFLVDELVVGQWSPQDGHYPIIAYQTAFAITLALQAAALAWFAIPWLPAFAKGLHSWFEKPSAERDNEAEFVMVPVEGSTLLARSAVEW